MMERQSYFGRLRATGSNDGPVGTESESKVWGKCNISACYLAFLRHLKEDKQKKWFVRSRITSRTIYPQCCELV
jgi:hypothetical protein